MISTKQISTVVIEATSHCNLHCPQCPRFDSDGYVNKYLQPGNLDFEKFVKNFDLSTLPNLDTVTFEGDYGDIMMHPRCRDFFEFFKTIPNLEVVTNGSMRSPDWWAKLAELPNLTVTFSIDGLEDTNHIYRINSNWQKIITNASAFINAGGRAEWKYIVFQHNEHQLETARQLAKDMGMIKFYEHYTSRSWWTGSTWPVKIDGQYQYDIHISKKTDEIKLREPVAAVEFYRNFTVSRPTCWLDQGEIYINYLGHVLPCCMHSGKTWQNDIMSKLWRKIVGDLDAIDITKKSLAEIISGEFYQQRLEQSFQKENTIHPGCVINCCSAS